ncbi:MAG: SDR family oxidoreductase [Dehalococcoidia bacterium]|nr:SDR family oxidoreductase [Dehalococcoidia bacterium]
MSWVASPTNTTSSRPTSSIRASASRSSGRNRGALTRGLQGRSNERVRRSASNRAAPFFEPRITTTRRFALKLEGKVAVVTGTSPNIMGGIAEELAAEGAKVVAVDANPVFAEACARSISNGGGSAIHAECDVTREPQVIETIAKASEAFGGVDILVNGAVRQNRKSLLAMPVDEWRAQVDIILTGAFLFSKHAALQMIEQGRGGSIINIISTEAHQGNPGNIGYTTCKSGLINFTRSVAMELSEHGIRVNSLTPTATDVHEGRERADRWGIEWLSPAGTANLTGLLEKRRQIVPLQKLPRPSDYGKAAVFLCSDSDAGMITGFDLRVDGGNFSRYWGWNPLDGPNDWKDLPRQ